MDFTKLFPPAVEDGKEETCQLCDRPIAQLEFSGIQHETAPDATFIDGGSAVLIATPNRAFGLIKVATIDTSGLERKRIAVHEYLVSITAADGRFIVKSQAVAAPDERIAACLDREIAGLPEDTAPESLIDPLRTLAEHAIAGDGIIVHDGSLRMLHPVLQQHCAPKSHALALAKTSGVLTSRQRPLAVALLGRAPKGAWTCELKPGIHAVRLHAAASHIFLLEGDATPEKLSLLVAWSQDVTFPGYPYPLVLADQLARVTNNERDAWKLILTSDRQASQIIQSEMKSNDAHAMLEHILYGKEF